VVSIPNYGVTPFGLENEEQVRAELLEYDDIASRIAAEYGIPFINITPISEEAKTDPDLIASDRLHPSGKMYSQWVSFMLPEIRKLLEQ
jgi:lysophospholipase L1-like esterase